MFLLIRLSVLLFSVIFIKASVLPETNDLFRLDIVHYNDFHDR